MPFLEYAFKNENNISPAPGIIIRLENDRSSLSFEVINSKNIVNDDSGQENNPDIIKLRRWLDLQLGKNYKLVLKNDEYKSSVKLEIKLSPQTQYNFKTALSL
jgi:hypothetical protein